MIRSVNSVFRFGIFEVLYFVASSSFILVSVHFLFITFISIGNLEPRSNLWGASVLEASTYGQNAIYGSLAQ